MRKTGSTKRELYLCFGSVALAALLSYTISQTVFWNAVLTTDEHAYLMQAYTLAEGKISRPLPPLAEVFRHEMMIMDEQAGWLSRYPPGHALWLIPGVYAGWPQLSVYLAAALSVLLFCRIGQVLGLPILVLPFLMVVSPYFLFMSGTLLSHTSAMVGSSLLLWGYLTWKVKKKTPYALIAGLAWSMLFLNRTYTGLLIAIPFAADALWDLARNRRRNCFFGTLVFAASAALGGGAYLIYNYLAVGDPFTPTYIYYAPNEGLGFGLKATSSLPYFHTFSAGLQYLMENVVLLDRWMYGFPGSLLFCIILALVGWHRRWSMLCLATVLSVACGYVFFWWRGVRDVGPVYYYETLPFILLAAGFGVAKISSLIRRRKRMSTFAAAAITLFILSNSIVFTISQGKILRERQRIVGQFHSLLRSAPSKSLIIVTGFRGMRHVEKGTSFNPRGLASDPLVVAGTITTEQIVSVFPERTPYLMVRRGDELLLEPVRQL